MTEGATEEKGKEQRRGRTNRSKEEEAEKEENGGGRCMMRIELGSEQEKKNTQERPSGPGPGAR